MPNLLLIGEMGSGKSTTANELISLMMPDKKSKKFKSGKSLKAVTKKV